jgi:predicted nucleic acid-binding protein
MARLVGRRSVQLQADLVACGHHRLPPADLLVAAIAEHHGLTVLHVDSGFDVIRDRTSAVLSAEWLAPPDTFA